MSDTPADPSPEAGAGAGRRAAAMRFIMVVVLIDMISIGLMIPVLPHIVGTFTSGNEAQTLALLLVTTVFGIANFLGAPVLGALSDRFGRRPVLLLGFAGLALSFFVTAVATALWMLVAVRALSGAMQSNISIANAYVADITPPEQRARRFGLLGMMFGIGFILGPVLGGLLGDADIRLPFFVAGAMALVNTAYGVFVLPESLPRERRRPFEWRRANPVSALKGLAALKGVGSLVWALALAALAQFMLHMTWVLYTKFKFGWGAAEVGWSLFAVGVVMAIGQGVLLKPLLERFSPQRVAVMGMSVGALTYLLYGLAPAGWMLYPIIVLGILGAPAAAAMQSIVSNAADATRQGQTMGSLTSLQSLMAVLGPVVGLELLRAVSHLPPGHVLLGLPLLAGAVLQAVAVVIAVAFFRRRAREIRDTHAREAAPATAPAASATPAAPAA